MSLIVRLFVLAICLAVGLVKARSSSSFARTTRSPRPFTISTPTSFSLQTNNLDTLTSIRGGSTEVISDEDSEDEDGGEEEEEKPAAPAKPSASSAVHQLLIQTTFGNDIVDHRIELMAVASRTILSLKESVRKQLPGKPPALALELMYDGQVLDDEMLLEELFEDDEDDEEDEESEYAKVLTLSCIPDVDPKFGLELVSKVQDPADAEDTSVYSTQELIDAYCLTLAAQSKTAQLLGNPKSSQSSSSRSLKLELQDAAQVYQDQLREQAGDERWNAALEPKILSNAPQVRGQRYRKGRGGASTNLKSSLQHNLNINWFETISNALLFLFFGYFGGKSAFSKRLLMLCAPLLFVLQTRPAKVFLKEVFYMLATSEGSILLSLLPAPQQMILSFDMEKQYAALYDPDSLITKEKADVKAPADDEVEEEEETESDEEDAASSDEEESSDDESSDDDE